MRRRLTAEEQALWNHVTAAIAPRRRRPAPDASQAEPPQGAPEAAAAPPRRRKTAVLKPPPAAEPAASFVAAADPFSTPKLDGKRAARFLKGELDIEGRIDLHGLTLDLAHKALAGFLMQARGRGHRMVLVITGKGAGKGGALKRLVPLWLSAPPFATMIAGLATARPRHGGEGALYLYLRRRRD